MREAAKSDFEFGCPLNNLAQEMSTVDAEFHRRIAALYRRWESGVAGALARGQKQDLVRKDVNVDEAATFVVASIEGAYGLAKNRKDRQPLRACVEGLTRYLDALRTPASRRRQVVAGTQSLARAEVMHSSLPRALPSRDNVGSQGTLRKKEEPS